MIDEQDSEGIVLAKRDGRYTSRKADATMHARIIALRKGGISIAEIAELADCSVNKVKRIWAGYRGSGTERG